MTAKSNTKAKSQPEFNLKHRITGAGVLIFFGVLVLPWMLGPPSEAQKELTPDDDQIVDAIAPLHSTFEDQVLAELEGADPDFVEPEESVYVSKITPVSGQSTEPQKQDDGSGNNGSSEKGSEEESKSMAAVLKKAIDKSREERKPDVQNDKTDIDVETDVETVNTPEGGESNSEAVVGTKVTKPVEPKVDVGWVVQVELLTDKEGANRLVQRLNEKGFSPQTTTVDTNLGKSTGTRIWLGPFAERSGAGRENDRLEQQMGKRGFIRVYP